MLLAILGAGASFDSAPLRPAPTVDHTHYVRTDDRERRRPPLATELFHSERPQFTFLERYPAATAVVRPIQRAMEAGTQDLEKILGDLQLEATDYPQRSRHLLALRFYLRDYLQDCSEKWWSIHSGVLTYSEFTDRIHKWSTQTGEAVCYLTFNYDTLLDKTLEAQCLRNLQHIDGYIEDGGPLYLKVHGSVNWRRLIAPSVPRGDRLPTKRFRNPQGVIESMIDSHDFSDSDEFVVEDDHGAPWAQHREQVRRIMVPAIAIPVEQKTERNFEAPASHLSLLPRVIQEANRILVIGWRGSEQHFNELLKKYVAGLALPITIVCGPGGAETQRNLESVGFCSARDEQVGFRDFVEDGGLDEYLA